MNHSDATKLLWTDPEYRDKISQKNRETALRSWRDPEYIAKHCGENHPMRRKEVVDKVRKTKQSQPQYVKDAIQEKRILSRAGLIVSQATIDKMSKSHLGKKFSLETRTRMALSQTGRTASIETKTKRSISLKKLASYERSAMNVEIQIGGFWYGNVRYNNKSLRNNISRLSIYKSWRQSVLERDNYICYLCNCKYNKMHVHHIKPISIIIEDNCILDSEDAKECSELWDINNGRTFCETCHIAEHY